MRELLYFELDTDSWEDEVVDEEFDREMEAAAAGDWEAAGLDPPPPASEFIQPVTIEEFMDGDSTDT